MSEYAAACAPAKSGHGGGDTTLPILQRAALCLWVSRRKKSGAGLPTFDIVLADGNPLRCVANPVASARRMCLLNLLSEDTVDPATRQAENGNGEIRAASRSPLAATSGARKMMSSM